MAPAVRRPSVGLVGGQQGGVHGLHARGAGEGAHEPVVDAVRVVDVHAGQEPHRVAHRKLPHADHALSVLLAAIVEARGQVLDEPHALRNHHLLFLGQLACWTAHVRRRVVHRHGHRLLVRRRGSKLIS